MLKKLKKQLALDTGFMVLSLSLVLFFNTTFVAIVFSGGSNVGTAATSTGESSFQITIPVRDEVASRDSGGSTASSYTSSVGTEQHAWFRWDDCSAEDRYGNVIISDETILKLGINKELFVKFVAWIIGDLVQQDRESAIIFQFTRDTAISYAEIMNNNGIWETLKRGGDDSLKPMIKGSYERGRFPNNQWVLDWAGIIPPESKPEADTLVIFAFIHDTAYTRAKIPLVKTVGRCFYALPGGYVDKKQAASLHDELVEKEADPFVQDVKRELWEEVRIKLSEKERAGTGIVEIGAAKGTFWIKGLKPWRNGSEGGLLYPYYVDISLDSTVVCLLNGDFIRQVAGEVGIDKEVDDINFCDMDEFNNYLDNVDPASVDMGSHELMCRNFGVARAFWNRRDGGFSFFRKRSDETL